MTLFNASGELPTSSPEQMPKSALTGIDCWVFDLDNTLYPASSNLFPQIHVRMRDFISQELKISADEALFLQKKYYRDYGTTLRGLMLVQGIEPDAFLEYVHDIDHSVLKPAPQLKAALSALPGRRLVFTNGSVRHAEKVIEHLGLDGCFEGIFDIAAADYVPKPDATCYQTLLSRHGVQPAQAAMFEDIARNLAPAAALGMTTILVRDPDSPYWGVDPKDDLSFVDFITADLCGWLTSVAVS